MRPFVIALMTCKNYFERRAKNCDTYWLQSAVNPLPGLNLDVKAYIIIGDPTLEAEYKVENVEGCSTPILKLRCPDNYEGLAQKTRAMYKAIYKMHPDLQGILKMDDDLYVNVSKLHSYLVEKQKKGTQEKQDFEGYVFDHGAVYSRYHQGRCEDPEMNKTVLDIPACKYCRGCFYYLGCNSVKCLIENDSRFVDLTLEDVSIGYLLFRRKIFAVMNPYMLAPSKDAHLQYQGVFIAVANPDPFDKTDSFYKEMRDYTDKVNKISKQK